jgi:dynein heavy chain, axonemal
MLLPEADLATPSLPQDPMRMSLVVCWMGRSVKMGAQQFEWHRITRKEPWPAPRWRHSATDIGLNRVLFFGGFRSAALRLNDCWIYNTVARCWEQLQEGSRSVDDYYDADEQQLPSPRGGHSAVCIEGRLWLFGGYGGPQYSRRDLNDTYCLDCSTLEWLRVQPKGTPPAPRSGHSAVAVDRRMFVLGGRSASAEHSDMFILDAGLLSALTWSCVATGSMSVPRWSHCTYALSEKLFIFGGAGGAIREGNHCGTLLNDIAVFDTGTLRWSAPPVSGDLPLPRSDAPLEYHSGGSRLVLCGGWACRWLSDSWCLDVSGMVGPAHAITGVVPDHGALTGGGPLQIMGLDFARGQEITIRFSSRSSSSSSSAQQLSLHVDARGRFLGQALLACEAPNFALAGMTPGLVDVRVAIGSEGYTTTSAVYTLYPVTDASRCFVYGPGLLQGGQCEVEAQFVIQARDSSNVNRSSGGDVFEVTVHYLIANTDSTAAGDDYSDDEESSDGAQHASSSSKAAAAAAASSAAAADNSDSEDDAGVSQKQQQRQRLPVRRVTDNDDGTYSVVYMPHEAGQYVVEVRFAGTDGGIAGPVRGSPCRPTFVRKAAAGSNGMGGPLFSAATEKDTAQLLQSVTQVSCYQCIELLLLVLRYV